MNILKQITGLATDSTKGSSGSTETWYITAERAEGIKDKDSWSKSDPYLKIDFGGKHVRTRSIKNDRTPCWNETFQFQLSSGNSKDIHLTLMDDDVGLDDKIGTATVSKADLPFISGEEKSVKVPILHKEQMAGLVHLRIKKIDNSLNSSSNYSQQQQMSSQSRYPNLSQQQQPSNIPSNQYPGYNNNNNNTSNYNIHPTYNPPPSSYNAPPPQHNMPYNNNYQGSYQGQMPPMNQQQQHMNMPQTNYPNSNNNYGDQYQQRRY